MTFPVIALCGIATDEASWQDMPVDRAFVPRGASIAAMAEAIVADLPDRFALCGHSMGGYVALEIALTASERVAGLALVSSSAAADTPEQKLGRCKVIAEAQADFETVAGRLARAMLSRSSYERPDLRQRVLDMLMRCGGPRFAEQQQATGERPDFRAHLGEIAVPALVVAGAEDRIIPPARSEELAAALPDAALLLLEACGHLPMCEDPGPVHAALCEWRGRIGAVPA